MATQLTKQADGTIQLTITIPASDIAKTRTEVMGDVQKSANLPGFRKGMAPKDLVEKAVDESQIKEDILKKLLPTTYIAAIEEHKLRPIINPKIHVESIEADKDWIYTAQTAEMPEVELGDYKKKVQDVTAKSKIVVPGEENKQTSFEEIVKVLLDTVKVTIPDVLLEQETDRLLSQTLNEIKSLGLSLDQYLASTGKTADALKEEYKTRARNDISIEFALQKIAQEENLTVEQKELEEALNQAKDENERQSMQANMHVLASILRQQKTLDFLKSL